MKNQLNQTATAAATQMNLESRVSIVSEISQRKTISALCHSHVDSKKQNKAK